MNCPALINAIDQRITKDIIKKFQSVSALTVNTLYTHGWVPVKDGCVAKGSRWFDVYLCFAVYWGLG